MRCFSYDLMLRCWLEDPEQRPSFADICKVLEDIVSDDVDTKDHDYVNKYVNDYLVLVELATERPSPKGYLPMSSGLMGQPLDTSTTQRQSPKGYLPMSGQVEATVAAADANEKDQFLGIKETTDDVLEV